MKTACENFQKRLEKPFIVPCRRSRNGKTNLFMVSMGSFSHSAIVQLCGGQVK